MEMHRSHSAPHLTEGVNHFELAAPATARRRSSEGLTVHGEDRLAARVHDIVIGGTRSPSPSYWSSDHDSYSGSSSSANSSSSSAWASTLRQMERAAQTTVPPLTLTPSTTWSSDSLEDSSLPEQSPWESSDTTTTASTEFSFTQARLRFKERVQRNRIHHLVRDRLDSKAHAPGRDSLPTSSTSTSSISTTSTTSATSTDTLEDPPAFETRFEEERQALTAIVRGTIRAALATNESDSPRSAQALYAEAAIRSREVLIASLDLMLTPSALSFEGQSLENMLASPLLEENRRQVTSLYARRLNEHLRVPTSAYAEATAQGPPTPTLRKRS